MTNRLRVLYVAYSLLPISDASCGGAEQALLTLESQMKGRGHQTMVAACSGSVVAGELLATGESPARQDGFEARDAEHVENILSFMSQQDGPRFDLIHDHGGGFLGGGRGGEVPALGAPHF